MFENKAGVLLIGGLGFFLFAFVSNGVVPILMYKNLREQPTAELANANVMYQFKDLSRRYSDSFTKFNGKPTTQIVPRR